MWFCLSKIVGMVATPIGAALVLLIAALAVRRLWLKNALLVMALLWCLVTACPWVAGKFALQLEKAYPPVRLAQIPEVDIIHVLGGGVGLGGLTNALGRVDSDDPYNLGPAADRAAMGARVWRHLEGRAKLALTGPGCGFSSLPFLAELGVDTNCVVVAEEPRTTEEEARWMGEKVKRLGEGEGRRVRVLVVTTAIHMRRAMMLYKKFALNVEAIAMPTYYLELPYLDESKPFNPRCLVPSTDAMSQFNCVLHEYLGYWARCWRKE